MPQVKSYNECATRLEGRGDAPPTRDYVDRLVAEVEETGIEAVWHSAVSQACRALFPSKVFPNAHPEANYESFHYLVDRLHAIGRPVMSWYALNHSAGVVEAHPEWQMIPLQGEGIPPVDPRAPESRIFCCINSPYGRLLPDFCKEIVRDVHFDGIWFDGSTFAVKNNGVPGCVCAWCRERFGKETGLNLPDHPDFHDTVFRRWINWRYDCLMEVWKQCVDAVLSVRADATVCFNNYRRYRDVGWHTGIPLRRLGWNAVLAGELDIRSLHGDFQMKMHRAYECRSTPESWMALCDHWMLWAPDMEPEPVLQAVASCAGGGGVMSMGYLSPTGHPELLRAVQQLAAPLQRYTGGDPIEFAAIWVSQQTQDFYHAQNPMAGYQAWHGANDVCNAAHLQTSVIFDDHVAEGRLGRYPVVVAANAACMSGEQAQQLMAYVEAGGVAVFTADAGTRDAMGSPYDRPVLDDWLGIKARSPGKAYATFVIEDAGIRKQAGRYVSCNIPHAVVYTDSSIQPLAGLQTWDFGQFDLNRADDPSTRAAGIWSVRHGRGWAVYLAADLFAAHHSIPTLRLTALIRSLMVKFAKPEITAEGPAMVVMNTRRQADGTWAVLLHNAPGQTHRYQPALGSGERLPIRGMTLRLNRQSVRSARSGLTGLDFKVSGKGRCVRIPLLDRMEVVILELEPDAP